LVLPAAREPTVHVTTPELPTAGVTTVSGADTGADTKSKWELKVSVMVRPEASPLPLLLTEILYVATSPGTTDEEPEVRVLVMPSAGFGVG
jgi:hypothetical protein